MDGSDEEIDVPPEVDSDEDFSDDDFKQIQEEVYKTDVLSRINIFFGKMSRSIWSTFCHSLSPK